MSEGPSFFSVSSLFPDCFSFRPIILDGRRISFIKNVHPHDATCGEVVYRYEAAKDCSLRETLEKEARVPASYSCTPSASMRCSAKGGPLPFRAWKKTTCSVCKREILYTAPLAPGIPDTTVAPSSSAFTAVAESGVDIASERRSTVEETTTPFAPHLLHHHAPSDASSLSSLATLEDPSGGIAGIELCVIPDPLAFSSCSSSSSPGMPQAPRTTTPHGRRGTRVGSKGNVVLHTNVAPGGAEVVDPQRAKVVVVLLLHCGCVVVCSLKCTDAHLEYQKEECMDETRRDRKDHNISSSSSSSPSCSLTSLPFGTAEFPVVQWYRSALSYATASSSSSFTLPSRVLVIHPDVEWREGQRKETEDKPCEMSPPSSNTSPYPSNRIPNEMKKDATSISRSTSHYVSSSSWIPLTVHCSRLCDPCCSLTAQRRPWASSTSPCSPTTLCQNSFLYCLRISFTFPPPLSVGVSSTLPFMEEPAIHYTELLLDTSPTVPPARSSSEVTLPPPTSTALEDDHRKRSSFPSFLSSTLPLPPSIHRPSTLQRDQRKREGEEALSDGHRWRLQAVGVWPLHCTFPGGVARCRRATCHEEPRSASSLEARTSPGRMSGGEAEELWMRVVQLKWLETSWDYQERHPLLGMLYECAPYPVPTTSTTTAASFPFSELVAEAGGAERAWGERTGPPATPAEWPTTHFIVAAVEETDEKGRAGGCGPSGEVGRAISGNTKNKTSTTEVHEMEEERNDHREEKKKVEEWGKEDVQVIRGHVVDGPWGVQCLTLAHPSYLLFLDKERIRTAFRQQWRLGWQEEVKTTRGATAVGGSPSVDGREAAVPTSTHEPRKKRNRCTKVDTMAENAVFCWCTRPACLPYWSSATFRQQKRGIHSVVCDTTTASSSSSSSPGTTENRMRLSKVEEDPLPCSPPTTMKLDRRFRFVVYDHNGLQACCPLPSFVESVVTLPSVPQPLVHRRIEREPRPTTRSNSPPPIVAAWSESSEEKKEKWEPSNTHVQMVVARVALLVWEEEDDDEGGTPQGCRTDTCEDQLAPVSSSLRRTPQNIRCGDEKKAPTTATEEPRCGSERMKPPMEVRARGGPPSQERGGVRPANDRQKEIRILHVLWGVTFSQPCGKAPPSLLPSSTAPAGTRPCGTSSSRFHGRGSTRTSRPSSEGGRKGLPVGHDAEMEKKGMKRSSHAATLPFADLEDDGGVAAGLLAGRNWGEKEEGWDVCVLYRVSLSSCWWRRPIPLLFGDIEEWRGWPQESDTSPTPPQAGRHFQEKEFPCWLSVPWEGEVVSLWGSTCGILPSSSSLPFRSTSVQMKFGVEVLHPSSPFLGRPEEREDAGNLSPLSFSSAVPLPCALRSLSRSFLLSSAEKRAPNVHPTAATRASVSSSVSSSCFLLSSPFLYRPLFSFPFPYVAVGEETLLDERLLGACECLLPAPLLPLPPLLSHHHLFSTEATDEGKRRVVMAVVRRGWIVVGLVHAPLDAGLDSVKDWYWCGQVRFQEEAMQWLFSEVSKQGGRASGSSDDPLDHQKAKSAREREEVGWKKRSSSPCSSCSSPSSQEEEEEHSGNERGAALSRSPPSGAQKHHRHHPFCGRRCKWDTLLYAPPSWPSSSSLLPWAYGSAWEELIQAVDGSVYLHLLSSSGGRTEEEKQGTNALSPAPSWWLLMVARHLVMVVNLRTGVIEDAVDVSAAMAHCSPQKRRRVRAEGDLQAITQGKEALHMQGEPAPSHPTPTVVWLRRVRALPSGVPSRVAAIARFCASDDRTSSEGQRSNEERERKENTWKKDDEESDPRSHGNALVSPDAPIVYERSHGEDFFFLLAGEAHEWPNEALRGGEEDALDSILSLLQHSAVEEGPHRLTSPLKKPDVLSSTEAQSKRRGADVFLVLRCAYHSFHYPEWWAARTEEIREEEEEEKSELYAPFITLSIMEWWEE